jgi:pimeloyl-ACP methyl ester carboxylesterase
MAVRFASNGEVKLAYESFGPPGGEPLLMVNGLGRQMLFIPDGFCTTLVERGFAVTRYDHRDSGLSSHFDAPSGNYATSLFRPGRTTAPYRAEDFADDAVAVLDALGWSSAHLCGGSMGAGVALLTAVRHPARVRSVTLTMAALVEGLRGLRYLRPGLFLRMARMRFPDGAEGERQRTVAVLRALASPAHPFDEEWAREVARRCQERRPHDMRAEQRQLAAGRTLRRWPTERVTVPTQVINGWDDPLARPAGGEALARRIRGARFVAYPGMGHDLPAHLWPALADDIATLTRRAPVGGHAAATG